MTIEEILSKMKDIYIEHDNYVDEDLLAPKATVYDLCMDSLDCVEFIMECEKEFNIAIPDAYFECVTCAEELAKVIQVILDKKVEQIGNMAQFKIGDKVRIKNRFVLFSKWSYLTLTTQALVDMCSLPSIIAEIVE